MEDAFEIVALAGRGRFGTVYKATGPSGPVALKRGADGWPTLQQDRDLARRLGRVEHAGVNLPVGWLREGDELWAILPWVDGADLTRVTEPMPQASALQAVAAVAEVLVHFKEQTVGSVKVPDLRPQHVRVGTGGEVSVVDLWHGRPDPEDEQHAEWLAPEVIKGRTAPLGDVYALGLLLHKLLGGHSLGVADTHLGRHAVQLSLALDGLSDGEVHEDVIGLVSDLLSFQADARPQLARLASECRQIATDIGGEGLETWASRSIADLAASDQIDSRLGGRIPLIGLEAVDQAPPSEPVAATSPTTPVDPPRIEEEIDTVDLLETDTLEDQGDSTVAEEPAPVPVPADATRREEQQPTEPAVSHRVQAPASERRRAVPIWALGVLAGGLLGAGAWLVLGAGGTSEPQQAAPSASPSPAPEPAAPPVVDAAQEVEPAVEPVVAPNEKAPPSDPPVEPSPDPGSEVGVAPVVEDATPTAPARPARAATPPPPRTQVMLAGDQAEVWLVNARGNRFALPGPIVAGSYEIQASFDDEALANVGTLLVPKQGSVVLTCSALFGRCSADD